VVFGVPYYFFAVIFALILARRVRATGLATIPDKLHTAYDFKTSLLGAVLTFFLVTPAPYVLMLGILVQLIFGWSLELSVLFSVLATTCYLIAGGFRSDVYTNALQFVLMFAGFGLMLPFAWLNYGGLEFLRPILPPLHLTWHGGNSLQFIAAWFFIALWTLVDPAFHQRCYAAKDGHTAANGILWSVAFWFVFDFFTSVSGLYARAITPNLSQPMFAYPMLAEVVLPPIAKGAFYIGMLATIMSTLSSLTFIGAVTFGNDIVGRMVSRRLSSPVPGLIERWTKIGLVITGVIAIVLALWIPSVVRLWYMIGTTLVPGLLVPLISCYFIKLRINATAAFTSMLSGWLISLGWLVEGQIQGGAYFLGIEPMYPGLISSLVVWLIGWSYLKLKKSA
jgi:SSS family solute:Na+ symporter